MGSQIIFSNEYINLFHDSNDVFIETFKRGFSPEELFNVLSSHPEINVTSFAAVRTSMNSAPMPPVKIGVLKERIVVEVSEDALKALVFFNLPKDGLDIKNRQNLVSEIVLKLKEKGIEHGLKVEELLEGELQNGTQYIVAEGTAPINGTDAVINMYKLEDAKPEVHKDGTVDFYELRLINKVEKGAWLGEKIDATLGIPGKSVLGKEIKALDGKNFNLNYDKSTVREEVSPGKITLYSRINGAVNYIDGRITVSNHLDINGDVDFKTGNIKFDGYVTIKGTVADGFSVEATRDIEINGTFGIAHVKGITSKHGSIFIKGGIASRNTVEIKAGKNVFTKFADNANITCGDALSVGFYCINSNVNAKEVIVESPNGHIIGGKVTAQIRISVAYIGSESEKHTEVEITGFDRNIFKEDLDNVFHSISELKIEQHKIKTLLSQIDASSNLSPMQRKTYDDAFERMIAIKTEIKDMEDKRKSITNYLKARGDGEIAVSKKIYPNCILIVKNNVIEIHSATSAGSYFFQDGQLKQIQ